MGSRQTYRRRYATPQSDVKVGRLLAFAQAHGLDPGQLALRWTLDTPGVTAVLLGVSRAEQLDHAIDASALRLDFELRNELSGAVDQSCQDNEIGEPTR
jgi:aryl-alcohol dehydrogenase-like predicted oxidoreductase